MDLSIRPLRTGMRVGDAETLARSSLFAALSPRELGLVVDVLDELALTDALIPEAREGAHVVLEGRLRLEHDNGDAMLLQSGSHFGSAAWSGGAERIRSARAEGAVRVARLSRTRYQALAKAHPALALHLLESSCRALSQDLNALLDNESTSPPRDAARERVSVRVSGNVVRADVGTPVRAFLGATPASIGGLLENRPTSLDTRIVCDASLAPLLATMPEGRQMLLRSLGLLVLEAAATIAPQLRVSWGPTLGSAHVALVDPASELDLSALAPALERAIADLIERAAPFREVLWTVEQAAQHFHKMGWDDAASLLRTRRDPLVTLVTCGSVVATRMGPLLSSAGDVGRVRVCAHSYGFLVGLVDELDRAVDDPYATHVDRMLQERQRPRFGSEMSTAQHAWLRSLGITSVGSFNEACIAGRVNDVVRVSEGFHEKRISQLADAIASRHETVRVIRMAGPSASGKTTFIERLKVQLQIDGLRPVNLSLDDYYVDRDQTPRDEAGELDFEAVEAIDAELLQVHVDALLRGNRIKTARFDFRTGRSHPDGGAELALGARDVLVLEGLHALNPALLGSSIGSDQSFGIFVHPATTLPFDRLNGLAVEDVRLLRRIVRDRYGRGYSAAENILRWPSVRRGELSGVFPCEAYADAVFDSSLVYELSILKVFAERYLLEVPEDHPAFPTALRLRSLIDQFVAIHPDHVPPTSLLREFIGGSGLVA